MTKEKWSDVRLLTVFDALSISKKIEVDYTYYKFNSFEIVYYTNPKLVNKYSIRLNGEDKFSRRYKLLGIIRQKEVKDLMNVSNTNDIQ